jgi:hypothetical protein
VNTTSSASLDNSQLRNLSSSAGVKTIGCLVHRFRAFVMALSVLAACRLAVAQTSPEDQRTVEDIRRALMRLPYYGVFDFLAFRYEKGTVTLPGSWARWTTRPTKRWPA